jgi:hypothetical protein
MTKIGYRPNVDVDTIVPNNKKLVSTGTCAALVQHYTRVGKTDGWIEGLVVKGNAAKLKKGTAIATFVDGKYPNKETGNHAAFYISQDKNGLTVVEQFKSLDKPQQRTLSYLGKNKDGTFKDPSNNGDAFSVIELKKKE